MNVLQTFLLLLLSLPFTHSVQPRRVLHQPLFPASSSPPPPSGGADADQHFFPEPPNGASAQTQPLSPPPSSSSSSANNGSASIPTATQPTKPAKKYAIAISVGIVTLGMLSALAFYIYKHKAKHPAAVDAQKLTVSSTASANSRPRSFLEDSRVEGSDQRSEDMIVHNHKLNSVKKSDRYRPSPDLQPLPPLTRTLAAAVAPADSPTATALSSSSEDESSRFYTPQGSIGSYEEGFSTPASTLSGRSRNPRSRLSSPAPPPPENKIGQFPQIKSILPSSKPNSATPKVSPHPPQPPPPPPPPPPENKIGQFPQIKSILPSSKLNSATPKLSPHPPPPPPPPPPPENRIGQFPQIKSILPSSKPNSATPKVSPHPPPPPPPPPLPMTTPPKVKTTWASSVSSRPPDSQFQTPELKTTEENDKPSEGVENGAGKSKLKPLHWDKVKATSDRATVWDQLKSSSFQLNEDMMESLFGCNSNGLINKETATRRSVLPPVEQENRVLDPKKSQNIAILLRALNVTRDEVSEALLIGNPEALGAELLETLVKMAPTKEEEIKLKDYKGDASKLGSAEKFLKSILDIPFAFKRVESMLYRANFDAEINYLRKSFDTLENASGELKNSKLFLKLLEAILRTGNRMNVGTNRGDAKAFKLDTLLKLVDIKGTDGKTTLLHFVVQEIIRSEGSASEGLSENEFRRQGLQIVSRLSRELGSVKLAAGMDSDVLHGYVSKLETGLEMVRIVIRLKRPDMVGGFFESMKAFLGRAEEEISRIKDGERKALTLVRDVTEYFHGNAAKEEAHPFRIFVIVRDFLSTLDHVCKDVGRIQERTVMGAARSFNISTNASLPALGRYNVSKESSSP